MGVVIIIFVIVFVIALGRYALNEGRKNPHNNKWRSGRSENDPVTLWNNRKDLLK